MTMYQLKQELNRLCNKTNTAKQDMDYLISYYQEKFGWSRKIALEYVIDYLKSKGKRDDNKRIH